MHRMGIVLMVTAVFLGGIAAEEEAADRVTVNLVAESEPVRSVAARITEQVEIQIAVTANTERNVTGQLAERTIDESAELLAAGSQASWMRAYMLESSPPEVPYSAEELLTKLTEARAAWMERLTDQQRQEVFGRIQRDGPGGGFGELLAGPGGAVATVQAREGGPEGARGGAAVMMQQDDPIRRLLLPGRTDTITLDLTDVSLEDALTQFTLNSRFLVVAEEGLDGTIALSLEDAPLADALEAIAEAAGAQWRPVYILGQPRQLTQAEMAQREEQREVRRDARFDQRWEDFWQRTPQERAESIQRRVAGVERMAERVQNAPPERRERLVRRQARMFDRMVGYSTQISPEQRLELRPLLQAMARQRAN